MIELSANWKTDGYGIDQMAFSPAGTLLATSGQRREANGQFMEVRLWDIGSGSVRVLADQIKMTSHKPVAFSPDGNFLAVGVDQNDATALMLWRVGSCELLYRLPMPGGTYAYGVQCLAFFPDSRTIAANNGNSEIWVWDLQTGKLKNKLGKSFKCGVRMSVSPDGA